MPDVPQFLNAGGLLLAMILAFIWWLALTERTDR